MPRILIPLLIALVAFGAMACNGDDDSGNGSGSPSATQRTRTPAGETPNGTSNGDKTPPAETPDGATPGTPVNERTPAPGGIPAVAPADQVAFLAQFNQQPINYQDCDYNPSTLLTDCGSLGTYSLDPPPVGQAECTIGIVESTAELLRCTLEEPTQTVYYDIQE